MFVIVRYCNPYYDCYLISPITSNFIYDDSMTTSVNTATQISYNWIYWPRNTYFSGRV
jgi:hypothetical protein